MGAMLELRGVEARYGPVRALDGVSLAVDEGQIVAVLGALAAALVAARPAPRPRWRATRSTCPRG